MSEKYIPTLENRLEVLQQGFEVSVMLKNNYWANDEIKYLASHLCDAVCKELTKLKSEQEKA